jgi:hypothetical protein
MFAFTKYLQEEMKSEIPMTIKEEEIPLEL